MGKKFISFLGTNEYVECFYNSKEKKSSSTFFIQEALLEHLKEEFSENDKAFIFLTNEAEDKNWLQRKYFVKEEKKTYKDKGLKQVLIDKNFNFSIEEIKTLKGESEEEIWTIFQTIVEKIDENDELYFDVTHGFRSQPMLALVVINYLKVLKNCKVKKIFYGAFETLGPAHKVKQMPLEERNAPIFELTSFDNLLDWTFAVNQFLKYGSATDLKKLSEQDFQPLMQETKGKHLESNELKKLANTLETFTNEVATCRGKTVFQRGKEVYQNLTSTELEIEDRKLAIPLFPLIKKINSKFEVYNVGNEKEKLIGLLEFCLEHNLIQQGLTIMEEGLTTLLCKKFGKNWENENDRKLIGQLSAVYQKEESEWFPPSSENKEFVNLALKELKKESLILQGKAIDLQKDIKPKILELQENVKNLRNDINHFGIREQPKSSKKFKEFLLNKIEELKKIEFLS